MDDAQAEDRVSLAGPAPLDVLRALLAVDPNDEPTDAAPPEDDSATQKDARPSG